jgi:hypothetical protein
MPISAQHSRHAQGIPVHFAKSSTRHGLRDRPGGAGGQRLQLSVSTPAEPLRDRGRQDACAVAGGSTRRRSRHHRPHSRCLPGRRTSAAERDRRFDGQLDAWLQHLESQVPQTTRMPSGGNTSSARKSRDRQQTGLPLMIDTFYR